ncbi:hypothetical protein ARMSODRAFT_1090893 [Armillaria solidipes]|uniref:Uncharacterized protein n=1 Tax=Armillaria solidipes TaxID=1076256 RepID=A0A2H3B826_9AGAR|nr:hypothetical protein ARMSODRAFT_1090893 [Armillaria solidipes]
MPFDTITPFRVAVDLEPVLISNDSTFTSPVLSQMSGEEEDVVLYPRSHSTSDSDDGSGTSFSSTSTAVATPNPDEDIENIAPFPFTFFVPHLKADRQEDVKALGSREHDYASRPPLNMIVVPEPKKREVRAPFGVLYERPTKKRARASFTGSQNSPLFPLSSLREESCAFIDSLLIELDYYFIEKIPIILYT